MDFEGHRRCQNDGDEFLAALYDWLFLRGYRVMWKWGGLPEDGHNPRRFSN
ncbi:hypothetical protein ACTRXD_06410 [Nitrospira sp. T9]|uniref:hypothetical protein n=1 Tax=unclassified Nitrospira TaxID=2652172 RepID=UPI003F9731A3